MRLELLPFEDSDGEGYCNISWDAFGEGGGLMSLMYPQGYTRAAKDWSIHHILDELHKKPDSVKINKVVDHDLPEDDVNGKMVGLGWWKIYPEERTEDELAAADKEDEDRGFPPDCNRALLEDFHGKVAVYKREILGGRPYVLLALLGVLPQYHRRGVGSMHLDAGLAMADQLGLPSYLEASPMGRPLYAKKGYEQVREFEFDARSWGLDRDLPHVCMLRPAAAEVNSKP